MVLDSLFVLVRSQRGKGQIRCKVSHPTVVDRTPLAHDGTRTQAGLSKIKRTELRRMVLPD